MSHSCSCTACSDLEMFLGWTWTMCGCWSGWRQRKRKDRGGFLFFPFLSSCSSVWTMAYSQKQTGIFINLFICSFIHQIFSVLGSGAKRMHKVKKKKKKKRTRVIIRRVWHLNLALWKLEICWTFISYFLIYYLPGPVLKAGDILRNNMEKISVFRKTFV